MGKRSKHHTHRRVSIRHNMDGSRTKTVTRSYRTVFGNTRSHTRSRRTGGYRSTGSYTRSGSGGYRGTGSSGGAGCGTVFLILLGLGVIGSLIKAISAGMEKSMAFVSENSKEIGIGAVAVVVLIAIVVFIRKRSGNSDNIEEERESELLQDSNADQSKLWQQQMEHIEEPRPGMNTAARPIRSSATTSPERQVSSANQKTALQRQQEYIKELQERAKENQSTKENEAALEAREYIPVPYNYPPITDLSIHQQSVDHHEEDTLRASKLEQTLESFHVGARVVHITYGPTLTRYELELASGTKANRVNDLEKEIMYGMAATSVLMEVPIPGKSLIGVSIPNAQKETVLLRSVLSSDQMFTQKMSLPMPLGKDRLGIPYVCDLAQMPHLLIAGQTGSGKTTCINSIITSILYRFSPDEIKLLLIDPKGVGLQCFQGIPHLLIPVASGKNAIEAILTWTVAEMLERFDRFAERRVQSIDGYNAALSIREKPMARIVVIIDGLDELSSNNIATECLIKIASEGGTAGIHLVLTSQRPSFDNVVGELKNNLPGRISFKVGSHHDSQIILGQTGAEKLTGCGDMLYLPKGALEPIWLQGCFLSQDEINNVVKHVRLANPSTYDPDILEKLDEIMFGPDYTKTKAGAGTDTNTGNDGNLFETAVEYAIADGQISTSTVQRRLKIGYARAGRLLDEMEMRGIVGPKEGSMPRKCLITRETWEKMKEAARGE